MFVSQYLFLQSPPKEIFPDLGDFCSDQGKRDNIFPYAMLVLTDWDAHGLPK